MNKKNIAYFLSEKKSYLGGADQTLFMQAVLMRSFHNVTVVLPCGLNGESNSKFIQKCKSHKMRYKIMPYCTAYNLYAINLVGCGRNASEVECFVLEEKIDILHSVQINPAVEYVSRKLGIPHVMNIYSLEKWDWLVPCQNIFPQYISCDSDFFLQKWKKYLGCKGKCVRVFGDMKVCRKPVRERKSLVIGTAGIVCRYKNQLEVIKAVEHEIDKGADLQLMVAGENNSPYGEECRNYIVEHGLQDRIHMLGFLDDMTSFLGKIDVLVCGSRRESFPASIVEAMSLNIPIISTPVAGVPEILKDGVNAYLAEDFAASALGEAIRRFYHDYENAKLWDILDNEKRTYEKFFSGESVKAQLEDLYADAADSFEIKGDLDDWNVLEEQVTQMAENVIEAGLDREEQENIFSRLLYLRQIRKCIIAKKCYIWGAGKWGRITKKLIQYFLAEIQIIAFVDNNREGIVEGIPVIRKEEMDIRRDTAVFLGFVQGHEEAVYYLYGRGMEILKNIFIMA
ncbi:MAG: glycosyltransferase family 4 protein [Lachnospiraceae bacterium]|nr:glycosyltransferase family 4 protein [Lachnospiraceae bacterium]